MPHPPEIPETSTNISEIYDLPLEEAFSEILQYVTARGKTDYLLRVKVLKGEYNRVDDAFLTDDQKGARFQEVHHKLLKLWMKFEAEVLNPVGQSASPKEFVIIDPDIHKNTCNRHRQLNSFKNIYESPKGDSPLQFYYVIGDLTDSVSGLIDRFLFYLRGNLVGKIEMNSASMSKVESREIIFRLIPDYDESKSIESTLIELKRLILNRFDIHTKDYNFNSLNDKTFQFILNNSSFLKDKSRNRTFLTHILINESDWDRDLVPEILESFFFEFFKDIKIDPSFKFLFFIGFEYDEEDGEEIRAIIKKQSMTIKGLEKIPALEKIEYEDIEKWFNYHRFLIEGNSDRKETLQKLFNDKDKLYSMEFVHSNLKQVIKIYNNKARENG